MGQGNYDHPSYLARQQISIGQSKAGASGTAAAVSFLSNMRIRNVSATIITKGTTSGAASGFTIQNGTTSVGAIVLSTTAAVSIVQSGDLNITVGTGTALCFVTGADGTVVANLVAEGYLDPSATWTGQE